MEKIAASAQLTTKELQKIALFGFATGLSLPTSSIPQEKVAAFTSRFAQVIRKDTERKEKLASVILSHVTA